MLMSDVISGFSYFRCFALSLSLDAMHYSHGVSLGFYRPMFYSWIRKKFNFEKANLLELVSPSKVCADHLGFSSKLGPE